MKKKNLQIILKETPSGVPLPAHFDMRSVEIPKPAKGEFLSKTLYLSLDPYMRSQIAGRHLSGSVTPGDVLRGQTVSQVVESKNARFTAGDLVAYHSGWQQYSLSDGEAVQSVDPRINPLSLALGILGMPGLTAYAGLIDLAEPKKGDVVVVSAATGAVGSMVGQIAKIFGCQVVGFAGSAEKCAWAVEQAGFDACINYRQENPSEALRQACPQGIDIYFDNVGGAILDAAMAQLAIGARVVLCGLMAQYNSDEVPTGPNPGTIIRARATVRGMVVYDHEHRRSAFVEDALGWLADGKIAYREDVTEGLEHAAASFCRLMQGDNFGKTIIKVS